MLYFADRDEKVVASRIEGNPTLDLECSGGQLSSFTS